MAELTIQQASRLAKELGRSLSPSYLTRLARTQPERIGARQEKLPMGTYFYLIDEDRLKAYIAATPTKGKQKTGEEEPSLTVIEVESGIFPSSATMGPLVIVLAEDDAGRRCKYSRYFEKSQQDEARKWLEDVIKDPGIVPADLWEPA